ncbi:MAG: DoxX family protein [Gammaproteobacteria bacterium]
MWLTGLEWVLGVFFLVAGLMKLFAHDHMVREFRRFQFPFWLMRLAGGIEVVAAPGLLLGLWLPWYSLLGALLLCGVMVGATYTNFVKRPPAFGWGTLVILGLCGAVVLARRDLVSPWI